jgi:hypothetical protein
MQEEVEEILPPSMWEYTKNTWYFGLVVNIFRRDPQLALIVGEALNDKIASLLPVQNLNVRNRFSLRAVVWPRILLLLLLSIGDS